MAKLVNVYSGAGDVIPETKARIMRIITKGPNVELLYPGNVVMHATIERHFLYPKLWYAWIRPNGDDADQRFVGWGERPSQAVDELDDKLYFAALPLRASD